MQWGQGGGGHASGVILRKLLCLLLKEQSAATKGVGKIKAGRERRRGTTRSVVEMHSDLVVETGGGVGALGRYLPKKSVWVCTPLE